MIRVHPQLYTVANGATTSDLQDLRGTLAGLIFPATMTSSTVSFQVTYDGTNYFDVYTDAGALYSVTVTASAFVALEWRYFLGARHIRLKTASAEGAARSIYGMVYDG